VFIILGGLGEQARAIRHYLSAKDDAPIITADIKKGEGEPTEHHVIDDPYKFLYDIKSRTEGNKVVVISCLAAQYNYALSQICCSLGFNMVDLGGKTEIVQDQIKLGEQFKKKNLCLAPDTGIAPGFVSSVVGSLARMGKEDIEIFCGGIPLFPVDDTGPLRYLRVFSVQGLAQEYFGESVGIENNKVVKKPACSDLRDIFIPPLGILSCANTSGGLSITPYNWISHLRTLNYMTIRYPGHWDHIALMGDESDTARQLENILSPVGPIAQDIIVLHIRADAIFGLGEKYTYFWKYDEVNNLSAMSQATGYISALMAQRIFKGNVTSGILLMENQNFENIIKDITSAIGRSQFMNTRTFINEYRKYEF
jgi:saccharopine dehydrogenase-like NADP-dependent oxidoreductase